MILGWFSKKKVDNSTIKHKVVSRQEASDEYVKYGEDMANSNNLNEAIACFDKAIGLNPKNDFAWGDRGLILDKQGKNRRISCLFFKGTGNKSKKRHYMA